MLVRLWVVSVSSPVVQQLLVTVHIQSIESIHCFTHVQNAQHLRANGPHPSILLQPASSDGLRDDAVKLCVLRSKGVRCVVVLSCLSLSLSLVWYCCKCCCRSCRLCFRILAVVVGELCIYVGPLTEQAGRPLSLACCEVYYSFLEDASVSDVSCSSIVAVCLSTCSFSALCACVLSSDPMYVQNSDV